MFSGIVEEIGLIKLAEHLSGKSVFTILATKCTEDVKIGDSIAVNGTCLTVVEFAASWFKVEAIPETLNVTNLKYLQAGHNVNLERSITLATRIGGHFVQGHVDGTTVIHHIEAQGDSFKMWFEKPTSHGRYLIPKGYITIDGMSLTVVDVSENTFSICIIPHTQAVTIVKNYKIDTVVNFEIDILSKSIVPICENIMKELLK